MQSGVKIITKTIWVREYMYRIPCTNRVCYEFRYFFGKQLFAVHCDFGDCYGESNTLYFYKYLAGTHLYDDHGFDKRYMNQMCTWLFDEVCY